ncbi:MAG TPA: amino acid adenylation domain-containing protein, partial [Candidatus Angelobacter sp.]|nr:amino acid adenylation domain-containing protein [Candidatus Angelobacter sp.]
RAFARRESTTLFITLLSAFQVLLSKYTGQSDVTIGTAIAGRNRLEIQNLIGFFVNTLPLRAQLAWNMNFAEVLAQAHKVAFDAYEHQQVPFKKLIEELQPERDLGRSPVFQVLLAVQPQRDDSLKFGNLRLSFPEIHAGTSKFDLTLSAVETEGGLRAAIEYNEDIFEAATVQRMAKHFQVVLEQMVAQPTQGIGDLSLLTEAERQQLFEEWNQTECPFAGLSMHELFARQAEFTPNAVAVIGESGELSYKELNCRANQLARHLMKLGVGPDTRVGVCMERNLDMVVALLGILKSGGAYLPLDPEYPRERLEFMLADAHAEILLTQNRFSELLPSDYSGTRIFLDNPWDAISTEADTNPDIKINFYNLAYVIYTSGSTGKPKGVAITHGSASVLVQWAQQVFSAAELRGVLASTSICFDLSVFEIFVPLSIGGSVILASNALALPQWLGSDRITLVNTVPSAMAELVRIKGIPSSVCVVNLAGEALHRNLTEQIYEAASVKSVFNLYGPSEDTTYSTFKQLKRGEGTLAVTIGRPIANTQAYVLDSQTQPVPVGVVGELYLGGAGLARGYLNRPEQTAERFVPNPFSIKPGERLYRTGDRVKWTHDGELEFLGRLDHQIKLRGFRIELGEIEAALLQHASVDRALAMVCENSAGEKQLVAYVVGSSAGGHSRVAVLRDHLRTRLPEYMVPAAFVEMQDFPLTPNGKVDRKALPAPYVEALEKQRQPSQHRPEEEILCTIFAAVLKREKVHPDQDFFELGGHSLLATQIISRVREIFGVDMPLRSVFEARTSCQLAGLIRQSRSPRKICALAPAAQTNNAPLSFAQQRIWFLDQMNPGGAVYNMPFEMRLSGQLNTYALERSLNRIVARHEALRTRFALVDGMPVQLVAVEHQFKVDQADLRTLPLHQRTSTARELVEQDALRAFNLASGPLLRVKLIQLEDEEYLLLVNMHHIVSDGWSVGVMVREFGQLYAGYAEGHDVVLPELKIQYRDYAIWQRERLQAQMIEDQLAYWRTQLAGLPILELPSRKLTSMEADGKSASERLNVSPEVSEKLRAMCRREGVTPFMALLAAFAVALADFSGQKDIAIGTPVANREHTETEGMIGLFLNTLVLRNDLAGNPTCRTLLRRTRAMVLDAHENQDVPFERLVEEFAQSRDTGKTPLFQAMISMQNTEHKDLELPGLRLSGFSSRTPLAKFDLLLLLSETENGIEGDLSYATQIYEAPMMERLMAHWARVLHKIATEADARISDLPLLSTAEFQQIVQNWNPPETFYPRNCIHDLFLEQVKRTPDAVAVKHKDRTLTFRELSHRANQLGHYLVKLGAGPETRVAICMERGVEMVIGLLAILKAGAAYVPLDPAYPLDRLQMMLEDAQAGVLVTQSSLADRFQPHRLIQVQVDRDRSAISAENVSEINTAVNSENLAYLIYTSGSTGKPKAVAIQHCSAAALLDWGAKTFSPIDLAGTLASTSICFDLSVFEIFQPLVCGGTVIMASNALELAELADSNEITLINTVPSAMRELIRMRAVPRSVRVVNLAGEELPRALASQIYELKHIERVVNLYGPSEDTTYSTFTTAPRDDSEPVTIGRAIANSQAYVLDQEMRPVPLGVMGELFLGGEGLARGYLQRPEITAERFVPNPFSEVQGKRLYCTGDQARWRTDGTLEFLGRLDHQIKLRGYRIEMGEIETALMKHASVEQAVVITKGEASEKKLVAYLVSKDSSNPVEIATLREHLHRMVPEYMMPAAYIVLEKFPLTRNGKVDRKALPEPEHKAKEYVAPSTLIEEALAEIWSEVLKVKRPGITDNFFEAGGHSLLAVQLISRVREVLHIDLPVRQLFERPTIETMAHYISNLELSRDNTPELAPISREAYRI